MKIRATLITMLVVGIALFAFGAPAFATHDTTGDDPSFNDPSGQGDGETFSGHWDNWTVNDTDNQGLKGYLFIPAFLRLQCDPQAIHGPPAGFNKGRGVFGGTGPDNNGQPGGCTRMAWDALDGWAKGKFFDPRFGTAFIPPSGDHHRSGAKMLMQVNFSGGAWMSGFAPLDTSGNFLAGIPGAGEAPEAVLEYCLAKDNTGTTVGINQFKDIPAAINNTDFDGDGFTGSTSGRETACSDWAALAGAAITQFLDHHGAPVTPGRFPRFGLDRRQGWPQTVVTKYVASSQNQGHGINQLFQTNDRFIDGSVSTKPVTWYSMTTQDAVDNKCGANGEIGWCEWLWDPTTHTLCRKKGAEAGKKTLGVDGEDDCTTGGIKTTNAEVKSAFVFSALQGLEGGSGFVLTNLPLTKFGKAPKEIYQKLGQWVEMDTDAAEARYVGTVPNQWNQPANMFTHNAGNGDLEQSGQAVWYEFWGLSGPNFQSEDAADPYTWRICGAADNNTKAEQGCAVDSATLTKGAFDSPSRVVWAIVDPDSPDAENLGGLNPFKRYGSDLRPTTGVGCTDQIPVEQGGDWDPALCGDHAAIVMCIATAAGVNSPVFAGSNLLNGGTASAKQGTTGNFWVYEERDDIVGMTSGDPRYAANPCISDPGTTGDKTYGTADDGVIYYREALDSETGTVRTFARENVAPAFSFINGIGVNHPDLCGTVAPSGPAKGYTECGDSPNTGTRQAMYQNLEGLGATLSCFNCSQLGQHTVPAHSFDKYTFKWTPLPGVHIPEEHPVTVGSIPESAPSAGNGFE